MVFRINAFSLSQGRFILVFFGVCAFALFVGMMDIYFMFNIVL